MRRGLQLCHARMLRSQLLAKILVAGQNSSLDASRIKFLCWPQMALGQDFGQPWLTPIGQSLVASKKQVFLQENENVRQYHTCTAGRTEFYAFWRH